MAKPNPRRFLALSLAALLLPALAAYAPAPAVDTAYSGIISDSICGARHTRGGTPAECTLRCVGGGASYALVVGTRTYTLSTTDPAQLGQLKKLAGERAVVRGTLAGTTLTVHGVAAAGRP
ncbi:MAG: hypothetical protein ACRD01_02830 [Terriglobales bacterium]